MTRSGQLCKHCQYAFDNWCEVINDEYLTRFPHCENIFALERSASEGCPLCGQFLRNLASRGELEIAKDSTIGLINNGIYPEGCVIRVVSLDRILSDRAARSEGSYLLELRFRLENLEVDDDDDDMSEIGNSSDEDVAFEDDAIRELNAFVAKAILMPADPSTPVTFYPQTSNTRLSLGFAKMWLNRCCTSHPACAPSQAYVPTRLLYITNDRVTLCPKSTLQSSVHYATLSHCWGSLRLLKLTRRSYTLLLEGVNVGLLCKTFQEAIYVCKELDLQYLWIDSLCIMQDDPEDWMKESKLMSSIYSNSTINIAATSAKDGNGGCFFVRDDSHSWRHKMAVNIDGRSLEYECIEDGIQDSCLFQTPLADRAWAIQERLLSPRTLHCSSTQLFWECNSLTACEAFYESFPDALKYSDFNLPKQQVSKTLWPKIVKLYTRCQLTFAKDKLVALSGIARNISDQNLDDQYMAGLWLQRIEQQLCWKVRTPHPRIESPRAPSWSWASVDGVIDLPAIQKYEPQEFIKVVDVDIGSCDPFGDIVSGRIVLNFALLMRGSLSKAPAESGSEYKIELESGPRRVRWTLDCEGEPSQIVSLLPVGRDKTRDLEIHGLILDLHPGSDVEYRRIGYFECTDTGSEESIIERALDGNKPLKHTIIII